MILSSADKPGPPKLDRCIQSNTRENPDTHSFYIGLAAQLTEQHGIRVAVADVREAVVLECAANPAFMADLIRRALDVANANDKYPQELPSILPSSEPELTPEIAYEMLNPELKEFLKEEEKKKTPAPTKVEPARIKEASLPTDRKSVV